MPRKFQAIAAARLRGAPDARERGRQREQTRQNIADAGRQSEDAENGATIGPEVEEITADHAVDLETDQAGCWGGVDRRSDPLRACQQRQCGDDGKHGDRQEWQRAGTSFQCACAGDIPDENEPGNQRQCNGQPRAGA